MIRISTLIALGLVVGHLSVLCRGKLEARSESALVDIDPDVSEHLDDNTQDQEDVPASPGERVNDPYWRYRFRYRKYRRKCSKRYRYGRRCKPTRKPYPSHKPHPTSKPFSHTPSCDSSRPPSNPEWNNDWRGRMFFQCPAGSSLISLASLFRDCQNDRIWKFGCGYNEAVKEHCHWTPGYANDAREGINYNCPNNGFLAGIASTYVDGDRRFKFKCCNDERFDHADCHMSHLLNAPGQQIDYKVDRDKRFYVVGVTSFFVPEKKDRRWQIDYCKPEKEQGKDYMRKKMQSKS